MTPQERQLVSELFDRLAPLESAPREPEAERVIAEGLARAPHAVYALVQTVLVQDEALKRANAHIEELERQLEGRGGGEPPREGGFLDNVRETLFGRDERRGSVPPVRPGGLGSSGAWGPGPSGAPPAGGQQPYQQQPSYQQPPYQQPPYQQPPYQASSPFGGGGSFLGTAAASAAGMIGGAMMLNGIRSMFGHSSAGALDPGAATAFGSPLGGSAGNSDLARDAGLNDIGKTDHSEALNDDSGRTGLLGSGDHQDDNGEYETADYETADNDDDTDYGGDDSNDVDSA